MPGFRPLPFTQVACSPPKELLQVKSYAGGKIHRFSFSSYKKEKFLEWSSRLWAKTLKHILYVSAPIPDFPTIANLVKLLISAGLILLFASNLSSNKRPQPSGKLSDLIKVGDRQCVLRSQLKEGSAENFKIYKIVEDMPDYQDSNEKLFNYFIFLKDSNMVISSNSAFGVINKLTMEIIYANINYALLYPNYEV